MEHFVNNPTHSHCVMIASVTDGTDLFATQEVILNKTNESSAS